MNDKPLWRRSKAFHSSNTNSFVFDWIRWNWKSPQHIRHVEKYVWNMMLKTMRWLSWKIWRCKSQIWPQNLCVSIDSIFFKTINAHGQHYAKENQSFCIFRKLYTRNCFINLPTCVIFWLDHFPMIAKFRNRIHYCWRWQNITFLRLVL